MRKYFGISLAILVIGFAGYILLNKTNISSYSFPWIDKNGKVSGAVSEKISKGASQIIDIVADKGKEIVDGIVDKVKLETFKIVKDMVDKKVESVGINLGVDVGGLPNGNNFPVVFSVKIGTPAYFTIQNNEQETIFYEADWGDERKDVGSSEKGKGAVLSHKWGRVGDYYINFKIMLSGGVKNYKILISVL